MKYLWRFFGMFLGNKQNLFVLGNMNNVNDTRMPDGNGNWRNGWQSEKGTTTMSLGGIQYDLKKDNLSLSTDVKVAREVTDAETSVSGTTFLPSGDVFTRTFTSNHNPRTHISYNGKFIWKHNQFYISSPLSYEYWNRKNTGNSLSAQFDKAPYDSYRGASLDSVFIGPSSQSLLRSLINQSEQQTKSVMHDWKLSYKPYFTIKVPGLEMLWTNRLFLTFSNQNGKSYEHYNMRYSVAETQTRLNRYFEQPSHASNVQLYSTLHLGELFQNKFLYNLFSQISYQYIRNHSTGHRRIYDLHNLPEEDEPRDLGLLPSASGWRDRVIDSNNSYFQRKTELRQYLEPTLMIGDENKKGMLTFRPGINFYKNSYVDTRSQSMVSKRYVLWGANASYILYKNRLGNMFVNTNKEGSVQQTLEVEYGFHSTPAPISYMLDIRDDSDPLRVSLGNAQLRPSKRHDLNIRFSRGRIRQGKFNLNVHYNKSIDDVAMGCTYNPQTGVYTYRPENVSGNWNTRLETNYTQPFGKNKLCTFYTSTSWAYLHSVDLLDSQWSVVNNHQLQEKLSWQVRFGKLGNVSMRANGIWYHATSDRQNYRTRNSFDIQYGPELSLQLPADVQVNTSFSVFQRLGYDDDSMNDCNLLWDASVSWNFDFRSSSYYSIERDGFIKMRKRGGTGARPWTLRLTCHDLLQQLSNTRRAINAQGITETWYNTVPAYVMLSISYRFSKMPKKR